MVMSPDRARDHAVSEQHVRLAQMLGQAKGKVSERIMYYRKPASGSEAGWIVTAGTNPERQIGLYAKGFVTLERWLGEHDMLFLRRDRAQPMVLLPWGTYVRLLKGESEA